MDEFLFIQRSSADEIRKICELNAKIESLSGMNIEEIYEKFKQGYTLQKQDSCLKVLNESMRKASIEVASFKNGDNTNNKKQKVKNQWGGEGFCEQEKKDRIEELNKKIKELKKELVRRKNRIKEYMCRRI